MKSFLTGTKNVLLWSYGRGSWQYDLLCLLIVVAVFLVPSRYFGDRDRTQAQSGATERRQATNEGVSEEVIDAERLRSFLEAKGQAATTTEFSDDVIVAFLNERCHCEVALVRRPETATDALGRSSYRVWFRVK